ncbi:MAG: thrombospondin type 3 repeat-containing protein [Pseudomonadota bacterium]
MNKRAGVGLTCAVLLAFGSAFHANAQATSSNYSLKWDVVDAGGGRASSPSYVLDDSIGQPAGVGPSSSASYRLETGFLSPPDFDADGVRNFMDNCSQDVNADQRDTNDDGFGNVCDADLNNDGVTNFVDLGILRQRFFTADADADLNGDSVVNFIDLGILRQRFFNPPGPSGIAP